MASLLSATSVPLHLLAKEQVLDQILGKVTGDPKHGGLVFPPGAEPVSLDSTHWRLAASVPGSETGSSSGSLTDTSSLQPLAGIPDIDPSLQRFVDAAAAALKPAQAAKSIDAAAASEAVAAALLAVEQVASQSIEQSSTESEELLSPDQFALLTATSTALAIIQTFAGSRTFHFGVLAFPRACSYSSFRFADPDLFKTCTLNLLGVLARADLSSPDIDSSIQSLLSTLRRTSDDVIASSSDTSGTYVL